MENTNNDGLVMKQIMEVVALAREDRESMTPLDPDLVAQMKADPVMQVRLRGYEQDMFGAGKMYRKVALSLMVCFSIETPMVEPTPPAPPKPELKKDEEPAQEAKPEPKQKKGKGSSTTPPKVRTRKVQSEDGFPQVPDGE